VYFDINFAKSMKTYSRNTYAPATSQELGQWGGQEKLTVALLPNQTWGRGGSWSGLKFCFSLGIRYSSQDYSRYRLLHLPCRFS